MTLLLHTQLALWFSLLLLPTTVICCAARRRHAAYAAASSPSVRCALLLPPNGAAAMPVPPPAAATAAAPRSHNGVAARHSGDGGRNLPRRCHARPLLPLRLQLQLAVLVRLHRCKVGIVSQDQKVYSM